LPKSLLPLEEQGLSLSHQNVGPVARLLSLLHQLVRRRPHRLGSASHFEWQQAAAVEMSSDTLSEVLATARAEVRLPSPEDVRSELGEAIPLITRQAVGNLVASAVDEDQGALLGTQRSNPFAVDVRQTGRLLKSQDSNPPAIEQSGRQLHSEQEGKR